MNINTQVLPSGVIVASSNTKASICFDRPWQLRLTERKPAVCQFEAIKLGDAAQRFPHICQDWLAIDNIRKNSAGTNKLIMPDSCWTESDIQRLGGQNEIEKAFSIAACLAPNLNVEGLFLLAQVGYDGGASVPWHLHWQLQTLEEDMRVPCDSGFIENVRKQELRIKEIGNWQATLGGKLAGECLFLNNKPTELSDTASLKEVSRLIEGVVNLYNSRFVSTQGLPPGFRVGFVIDADNTIRYGAYKPVLYHQWGMRDAMSDYGLRVKLPWPHELTQDYLLA